MKILKPMMEPLTEKLERRQHKNLSKMIKKKNLNPKKKAKDLNSSPNILNIEIAPEDVIRTAKTDLQLSV